MRLHYRADTATLDAFQIANGRLPRSPEWPRSKVGAYDAIKAAWPNMARATVSLIERRAHKQWSQYRWDTLIKQVKSPPHFKQTMPLPLRADAVHIRQSGKDFVLSFSLHGGTHPHGKSEFSVPVVPRDGRQQYELEALATGRWKLGDVAVQQDRLRPGRWFLRFAYTTFVPLRTEGLTAAINRGMIRFLAAVVEGEGTRDVWLYPGAQIEAFLKQVQARRRAYQNDSVASARWGHGRKRTLLPLHVLEDKGHRWRRTMCQTIARRFVDWLVSRGVSRLVIEDFSGIRDGEPEALQGGKFVWDRIQEWPYHDLETRIKSCCAERGIVVQQVPAHLISQKCPECGHTAPENTDLRHRKLTCVKCAWSRDLDIAAALNVLARGRERRGDAGVDDAEPQQKSAGRRSKKGGARKPPAKPS
jgi:hypothetical protein